jgi:signal transduction histidine kinase
MTSNLNDAFILNVDDTEAARYAKTRILTRAGARVIEAATGTDALRLAREQKPDLMLLDIKLPDINGFEVCRRLKADPETQSVLILQTSASYIASADKIRALEGGADNYLFEPIEPEELVANVKALVRLGRVERELREAARRKDVFLATLAHELRNPLAPILTAVELLAVLDPHAPESRERARQTIFRQTNHMVRLVDDLLDVSRINNGKIALKHERVELHTVIHAAIETAAAVIEQAGHTLVTELPAAEVWLEGDNVRLAQIVSNLLNNAAKFTPPGGRIALSAEALGNTVRIRVTDNGIGLPPENAAAIFDLFVQAGHLPERSKDGLGIGLSLVKGLVELHGGTVRAMSAGEGQGSTFEVMLPIAADLPRPTHAAAEEQADAGSAHRILVVDDNIDGAEMIAALLTQQGHTVAIGHSGTEALEKAASFHPDVIILDIGLPDASGHDIAGKLRQCKAGQALTLIALTGFGTEDDKENARAAGFDHHLTKPVSFQALLATLAHAKT